MRVQGEEKGGREKGGGGVARPCRGRRLPRHGELEEGDGDPRLRSLGPGLLAVHKGEGSGVRGKRQWRCGEKCRARAAFYSGRAAHGGRGAGAPVAVLGRRRPVEGAGWVAGLSGDRAGKVERRGALGCVRVLGPAVGVLGRCTACASWRGRGVHGLVLVCAAGAGGDQGVRESEGGGTARPARRGVVADTVPTTATCARPWLSPTPPRRLR